MILTQMACVIHPLCSEIIDQVFLWERDDDDNDDDDNDKLLIHQICFYVLLPDMP